MGGRGTRADRSAGLRGVRAERERLPLPAATEHREPADSRLAGPADGQPPELWVWSVLPVSAQREGFPLEPQARLSHLPEIGVEPAYPPAEAPCTGQAGGSSGAQCHQPDLAHGLHARPVGRRPIVPPAERHRRLQPGSAVHRGGLLVAGRAGYPHAGPHHRMARKTKSTSL